MNWRFVIQIFLVFSIGSMAQIKPVDSLLQSKANDTVKCKILNDWIEEEQKEEVWLIYNEQLKNICNSRLLEVKDKELLQFYRKMLATSLNNYGYAYQRMGKPKLAELSFIQAIQIQKGLRDKEGLAASTNNYAQLLLDMGKIEQCIKMYNESINLYSEVKDSSGLALSLTNLAYVHQQQSQFEIAEKIYLRCIDIRKKMKDNNGISGVRTNLAALYISLDRREEALRMMKETIELQKEIKDFYGLAYSYNNLAYMYEYPSQANEMLETLVLAADLQKKIKDDKGLSITLNNISSIYLKQLKYNMAEPVARESFEIGQKMGSPALMKNAAITLSAVYENWGQAEKALHYYEVHIKMRDSINNIETRKASLELQMQYEFERKMATDSIKNAEASKIQDAMLASQSVTLKKQKLVRYTLILGFIFIFSFLFFYYKRFKEAKQQAQVIEKQKAEVDQAFHTLHERNKEILDSIHYAKRIQSVRLPNEKYLLNQLKRLKS